MTFGNKKVLDPKQWPEWQRNLLLDPMKHNADRYRLFVVLYKNFVPVPIIKAIMNVWVDNLLLPLTYSRSYRKHVNEMAQTAENTNSRAWDQMFVKQVAVWGFKLGEIETYDEFVRSEGVRKSQKELPPVKEVSEDDDLDALYDMTMADMGRDF